MGFVEAERLGIGCQIVTRAGPALAVKQIDWQTRPSGYLVYNFEVADDHTYFVGQANGGAWVHNIGECGPELARTIGIVEQDGDVVRIVGNGPKGSIEVIASMRREGDSLIFSGAHIDGPGKAKLGIHELAEFARQFGRQQNVREIVIEGARRTTGARIGHIPRPFRFPVN